MEAIFFKVLNMSLTASYVIAAVMLIRLILKKAPKKYSYMLWSVAAFRLCCPFSFRSVFSIFSLKPFDMTQAQQTGGNELQYVPQNVTSSAVPQVTVGIPYANRVINSNMPVMDEKDFDIMQMLVNAGIVLWIIGMAVMLVYAAASYIRLYGQMKTAMILEGNVYQSDRVSSPFILGFIKPGIYIPFGLDETTLRYVLTHERYHIKRLDHIVKAFGFLLLTVHWFNPLCWLAFILMGKDMEMSCDEKVLSGEENIRKAYSTSLLSFATNSRFPSPSPLAFGETGVKTRIKNALNWKKPKIWITVIALVLCVAVVAACAANPVNDNGEIDLSDIEEMNIGAEMPAVIYGDHNKMIMQGTFGLIVYDIANAEIYDRISYDELEEYGISFLSARADENGKEVYLTNFDPNGTEEPAYYCYNVDNKKISEAEDFGGEESADIVTREFNNETDAYSYHTDYRYLNAYQVVDLLDCFYYLRAQTDWSMKSLQLVHYDRTTGLKTIHNIFEDNDIGGTYGYESLVYADGSFSYVPIVADGQNIDIFREGDSIIVWENEDEWIGGFELAELTAVNFDKYFTDGITDIDGKSCSRIRRENKKAWYAEKEQYFYYVLQQKNGEIYLSQGLLDFSGAPMIRWMFKLSKDFVTQDIYFGENYVATACYYMVPYSSYMSIDGDSGYIYNFIGNSYAVRSRGAGEVTHSVSQIEWAWQDFPYTAEEWEAMFLGGRAYPPSDVLENVKYQPLDDGCFLMKRYDTLLFVTTKENDRMGRHIYSIYSIVPQSTLSSAQWSCSSSMKEFSMPFEFDVAGTEIELFCAAGEITDSRGNSSGEARYLTVKPNETFYWSPFKITESGTSFMYNNDISFNIYNGGKVAATGTIFITSENTDGEDYVFTATAAGGKYNIVQSEGSVAVISRAK